MNSLHSKLINYLNITTSLSMLVVINLVGCTTTSLYAEHIYLEIDNRGIISICGKTTPRSLLLKNLDQMGVSKKTRIIISLPKQYTRSQVMSINKLLSTGGYVRIHFEKPKKATSYLPAEKTHAP